MPTSNPLSRLNDIILPNIQESGWPALGWWLSTIAIIILICIFSICAYRFWQHRYNKRLALRQFKTLSGTQPSAIAVNQLLKQAVQQYFPRQQIASLNTMVWFEFLNQQTRVHYFSKELMIELSQTLYQYEHPANQRQLKATELWLKHALPPKRRLK
ncbi:MAG: hypothetical protein CENE_03580 [Candidatus Celerinatantimonas neptuna]|nr:MAG: hypothetical protein CENE_03580 [Candidatus Celerinatantimonas neptuna]